MRAVDSVFSLNRGVVSKLGLARLDVKRLALAAQVMTNWIPKVLGPMILRPGLGYIATLISPASSNVKFLRFIFATDDLAMLELSDSAMRVWINDAIVTRPLVSTIITNGTFDTDLTGWTDLDDGGATSSWSAGKMQLVGNGTAMAVREQHVVNASPHVEHGIRIVVTRGPATLRIGSTSGDDDILAETTLYTGTHSLAITPSTDFYIRFSSTKQYQVLIDSCTIEAAGEMVLPTPWVTGQFNSLRYDQSGDVVFVACKGVQQRRIERRGARPGGRSWSVVLYQSPDGPFMVQNVGPITLSPSAITGNITLTSSQPLFKPTHVGALFSHTSIGQSVAKAASGTNQFTDAIRVTGLKAQRGINITISGTFVATVVLQQSFDNATWADVPSETWTAPIVTPFNDGLDNQIVYYRLGIEGTYTSGTANCLLSIGQGSIRGIVRVTGYTSSTSVSAEVLTALGGTTASTIWEEGKWSDLRGWPTAVGIHEGRMWWAGQNGTQGSISDAYDSFDETFLGDAGPIDRTIGSGPVDNIEWILSLKGMCLGAQGAEFSVRSSSLDEPLTPTNFNMKASSTQGSGITGAVKIDQAGYFTDRTTCKMFELAFDVRAYDYTASDLMALAPEIGLSGIVRIDVQRKPDTRIHAILNDGTALVGVINRQEDVLAWVNVQTDGLIEDVLVMPAKFGNLDDDVYYVVRRTVNGNTVRFLEKWAQELDTRGDKTLCLLGDAYTTYIGAPEHTASAPHLEGKTVCVWGDGQDLGTFTVTGGVVTLPQPVSSYTIGLPYTAPFQSAKLGLQQSGLSPLNQQKKGHHLGLILGPTHRLGLKYGADFDFMDDLPLVENGALVTDEVRADYDENLIEFPGLWTTDMRVCLQAQAPRPACVMAVTLDQEQNS